MRASVLLRLAFLGTPIDRVRAALTAAASAFATLGVLAAATVLAVPLVRSERSPGGGAPDVSPQYSNPLIAEAGLRPGVAFALLLLTVPVLVLAGQAARLGTPARARRLDVLRRAGASPTQVGSIVAAEAALAAAAGALVGLAGHLLLRVALHRPDAAGQLPLPTDVLPSWLVLASATVAVPVIVTLTVLVAPIRHIARGSQDATRTSVLTPPQSLVLLLGGCLLAAAAVMTLIGVLQFVLLLFLLPVLLAGVVLPSIMTALVSGWLLDRTARGPAGLLAARLVLADPWATARSHGTLFVCAFAGAAVAGQRTAHRLPPGKNEFRIESPTYEIGFSMAGAAVTVAVIVAVAGLLVSLVEAVLTRRRAHAALVAGGTPRSTLTVAITVQTVVPAAVGVVVAIAPGLFLGAGPALATAGNASHALQVLGAGAVIAGLCVAGAAVVGVVGGVVASRGVSIEDLRAT